MVNPAPHIQDAEASPAGPPKAHRALPDVLLVISHLGHGGTQRVVCNLANGLVRRGYRVRVLLSKQRSNNALALDPAVEVEPLIYTPPRRTFAHLAGLYSLGLWLPVLRRRIREIGAPVLVTFIRPTNVKVLLAALGLKSPRIVVCERNDPQRQPLGRHWNLLSRLLYRTADVVTVNSRGARKSLANWGIDDRLRFVPNILTLPTSEHSEVFASPTILAVGRIVHQKGYDVLIRAFAEAGEKLADWRIVFLGAGPAEPQLRDLAENLGLAGRIEWRGHVADPFPFYRGAAVFALPSRYEGMPNALLEAMSCGLPSIVSDASPGPLELVTDGENGLIVPVGDVAAMSAALLRLAGDDALREKLGGAAQQSVEGYLPETALDAWKAVLGLPPASGDADAELSRGKSAAPAARRGRFYLFTRQIAHFAIRPQVWPDLARWLAKRIKDRIVGRDKAAEEARRAMAEATAWCMQRAQSQSSALAALGISGQPADLETRFPEELAAARDRVDSVPFRLGGASNMNLIYTLCEALKATRVVETGVANGWSSLAILLSISERPGAALHSVDLPYLKYQNDRWVGIAVPEHLKAGWTLHRMPDRDGLPRALEALGSIDFAHYDSDKSPAGRAFAYPLLWQALRPGGLLFSDDINDNFGFRDFCDRIGQTPIIIRQENKFQGILRKPDSAAAPQAHT